MKNFSKENMDNIFRAIVSIYINLLNTSSFLEKDSNLVYNILNSIFGTDIDLLNIQEIISNIYSMRESVNVLKKYLNKSDRIKLIINLLSFLYRRKNSFQIIGSLEIVKLVDLLYIDLNFYDQILDVLDMKTKSVEITLENIVQNRENCILKNDFLFGNRENTDVFVRSDSFDKQLYFLMFENINFVGSFARNKNYLNNELMEPNRLYVLNQRDRITLGGEHDITLNFLQILSLQQHKNQKRKQSTHYQKDKVNFDLIQDDANMQIKIKSGKVNINGKMVKGKHYLAINDYLQLDDEPIYVIDLLLRSKFITTPEVAEKVHYLEYIDNFIQVNLSKNEKTIAKIEKVDKNVTIQSINDKQIFINNKLVKEQSPYSLNKDIFSYEDHSCKINRFFDIIKIDHEISELTVTNLFYQFEDDNSTALNGINFTVKKGEMMSIMGPSGSGKTTLLRTLLGEINIDDANIEIDGKNFFASFYFFQKYISYVPQQDLLFANLTVYENLYYSARLRLTHINDKNEISRRIEHILKQIGLWDKRNLKVGDQFNKTISGGQRKRLNVALELLSDPLIIFMDEPTSGLSSKDSEKMIDMMNELKQQGKIIIATIHQPNPDLFQQFDKFLFLDKMGTQVFFGNTNEVFEYFDDEYKQLVVEDGKLQIKKQLKMPEYLFDILEFPQKAESSNNMGVSDDLTEDAYGNRRFSPTYWKEKYKRLKLFELLKDIRKNNSEDQEKTNEKLKTKNLKFRENIQQFNYLFLRNITNKFNNKMNLFVTFIAAPILSLIISFILRYRGGAEYVYFTNKNGIMFTFISIIIFIFLGLANSLDDILSERLIFLREKKVKVKTSFYLMSKAITLNLMTLIQVVVYVAVAYIFMENKGMWHVNILFYLLSGMVGYSIGLLASAMISDRKAIIGILPLVLIPQIIFAGAVIMFEDMNQDLIFSKNRTIPEFCEVFPSKWLFEGAVVAQSKWNYYNLKMNHYKQKKLNASVREKSMINREKNKFIKKYNNQEYQNKLIKDFVLVQDGKYTNRKKNFFCSSFVEIRGKKYNKIYFDITIILLMITLFRILTYIKLRFFYR